MKFQQFTKQNIGQFRAQLQAHLDEFEKQSGVRVAIGNMRYTADSVNFKPTVQITSSLPTDPHLTGVPAAWLADVKRFMPQALLKRFDLNGRKCVVVGMKGRDKLIYVVEGQTGPRSDGRWECHRFPRFPEIMNDYVRKQVA